MSEQVNTDEIDYVKPDKALIELAVGALAVAERTGLRVVTAESCTGGFIAAVLSEAPGAAEYFEGPSSVRPKTTSARRLVSNPV